MDVRIVEMIIMPNTTNDLPIVAIGYPVRFLNAQQLQKIFWIT
jgi:hypothetical protein